MSLLTQISPQREEKFSHLEATAISKVFGFSYINYRVTHITSFEQRKKKTIRKYVSGVHQNILKLVSDHHIRTTAALASRRPRIIFIWPGFDRVLKDVRPSASYIDSLSMHVSYYRILLSLPRLLQRTYIGIFSHLFVFFSPSHPTTTYVPYK